MKRLKGEFILSSHKAHLILIAGISAKAATTTPGAVAGSSAQEATVASAVRRMAREKASATAR